MGVEPEKVLEQQRVAALGRVEKADAEDPLGCQQQKGDADHRRCQYLDDAGGIHGPDEQGQAEPGHPRGPQPVDGYDEVQTGEDGATCPPGKYRRRGQ